MQSKYEKEIKEIRTVMEHEKQSALKSLEDEHKKAIEKLKHDQEVMIQSMS